MSEVNLRHVRTEEQRALYEKIQEAKVCSFCEDFCRGQAPTFHPNPVLKETRYWAFTECFPPYEGAKFSFLIVSKYLDKDGRHALFPHLPTQAWQEWGELIQWAVEKYDLPAGAFACRFGDTDYTGASISHLHAHLLFGGAKDGERLHMKLGYKQST